LILIAAALLGSACSRDPAAERMKEQVRITLREHRTAEFADIRPCPRGQGYAGTVTADDGNDGRSGAVPFIVIGQYVAVNEDAVPEARRITAGAYEPGRYAILQPRCFG
jgi:hypothetical protein